MAHEWEDVPWDGKGHPLGPPKRECIKCGAQQERHQDHAWGRVVRTYWEPKIGRCSADKKSKA